MPYVDVDKMKTTGSCYKTMFWYASEGYCYRVLYNTVMLQCEV